MDNLMTRIKYSKLNLSEQLNVSVGLVLYHYTIIPLPT